jgi:DNA polymerase I-like protein with 3'-5' exonuclease and polymerase domains
MKDFRKIPLNRLHWYAGLDVDCTLRLAQHQMAGIPPEFLRTWRDVHGPATWMLGCMERWGALLSEPNVREYDGFLGRRIDAERALLGRYKLQDFNPKSNKQMADLVFGQLGLKYPKGVRPILTKGKAPSTSAEAVQTLIGARWGIAFDQATGRPKIPPAEMAARRAGDEGLDVIMSVLDLKDAREARSKFGLDYLKHVGYDGRVHTTYGLARSGRLTCIAVGTLVEVVRDVSKQPKGVPIEEVRAGDLVYCFDEDLKLQLRPVRWAGKTGVRKVVRLHWRGSGRHHDGHVDLTPDHRVRMVGGAWRRADALVPGDRLMALSRGVTGGGYARLWPTGQPEIKREHRFVWAQLHPGEEIPEHVHHEDENPLNNLPVNLVGMTAKAHASKHGRAAPAWLKRRRVEILAKYRRENPERMASFRGLAHEATRLSLTETQVLRALEANGWSMYKASRATGVDYGTLKGYASKHGLPLRVIRRLAKPQTWSALKRANHPKQYAVGSNHEVVRVEVLEGEVDVYDIGVEGVHNFVAGEICVHNSKSPQLQNLTSPWDSPDIAKHDDPGWWARRTYVPPEGWEVVSFDFGQVELRMAAELSGDDAMKAGFTSGVDFHTATAIKQFGKPADQIIKAERRIAKIINFRIPYGTTALGLSLELGCTVERAEEYLKDYNVAYPKFASWRRAQVAMARTQGESRCLFNGWVVRRRIPEAGEIGEGRAVEKMIRHAEAVAQNNPVQATANLVCLLAMVNICRWLHDHQKVQAELNMNVHDAAVLYVRRDFLDQVIPAVHGIMASTVRLSIPLVVDVEKSALSYGDLEKVKL